MPERKRKDREKLYQDLRKMAVKIESFGLGCIVVDNPFRGKNGDGITYSFIITQPNPLEDVLGKEEFIERTREVRRCCEKELFFGLGPTILLDSLTGWFDFLDKSEKHPILSIDLLSGSTDIFLSKVIYGAEKQQAIIGAFQRKYGPNFIQDCYRAFMENLKKRRNRLNNLNRKIRREVRERKKPLNRYEVRDIKNFLSYCAKAVKKYQYRAIVGVDCSGRPLAVMLHQLLEKINYSPLPLLEFLDPHQLRKAVTWKENNKAEIPEIFVATFQKEFPAVCRILKKDAAKVLFVDDQIYSYAHTSSAIVQLVKQVIGDEKTKISLEVLSGFNGYNAPTWWKDKSLLRIKNNQDNKVATLRAIPLEISPEEEAKIREFESKLSQIVESVSKTLKKEKK